MNGFEILLLVLVILLIVAAAVILLRKQQGKARAESARRDAGRQTIAKHFEPPARETRPSAPLLNPRRMETVPTQEQQATNPERAFAPKTPGGSQRVVADTQQNRTLRNDDIVTTPAIYGGSLYAAPSTDPLDRDAGTREAYADPSPAADPSPSSYSASDSSSSDSGSSGGGSD